MDNKKKRLITIDKTRHAILIEDKIGIQIMEIQSNESFVLI